MSTLEDRLAEEIERVGGIIKVSVAIGVDRNTIRNWINNGTVTSKRLQELAAMKDGIDLQYVLLGARSPKEPLRAGITLHEVIEEVLTPEEAVMLDNFRHCSGEVQQGIKAQVAAMAKPKGRMKKAS